MIFCVSGAFLLPSNLLELWTLLHFIEPSAFPSLDEFNSQFGVLEKNEQVKELQERLSPFLLRRMKEDVARNIPPKEETVIQVELTSLQKQFYRAVYEKNRAFLYKGCKGNNVPHLLNVVMQLRKVCSHPFLLPGVEDQVTAGSQSAAESLKALVSASGKLVLCDKLLPKLQAGGHKVLIFSQMKMILDLLEYYCKLKGYAFERLDGSIRGNDRQAAIDRFSRPDSEGFIFMLSTRAGGLGINLVAADTVIIFDSDWNPQQVRLRA
jgi:chromodomain-helicase-DNA-binding protein 7